MAEGVVETDPTEGACLGDLAGEDADEAGVEEREWVHLGVAWTWFEFEGCL